MSSTASEERPQDWGLDAAAPGDIPRPPGGRARTRVLAFEAGRTRVFTDQVVTEEPLEIRLEQGGEAIPIALTMRTPGADYDLVAGFLYGEGIVAAPGDIRRMTHCVDTDVDEEQRFNIVSVELREGLDVDLRRLQRHFFTNSACGVCGKAALEQIELRACPRPRLASPVAAEVLTALPGRLREAQGLFQATGGLHAAGLFDKEGRLVALREDVGRHNALDKLVGWAYLEKRLPLDDQIILVSGRASFELLQKAVAAGAPVFCAVSAPSSLAVEVARSFGVALVGFLRGERFNVYAGEAMLLLTPAAAAASASDMR